MKPHRSAAAVLIVIALVAAALVAAPAAALAQGRPKVKVAMFGRSFNYVPIMIAEKRGFFPEEGLDAEVMAISSSQRLAQALISGFVEFSTSQVDTTIRANEKGGNLKLVAGLTNKAVYTLVAGKKYKTMKDLKGTTLGVSDFASGDAPILQIMLRAHGLTYPQDYRIIEMGGTPQRWAGVQSGGISAGMLLAPISFIAMDQGYPVLGEALDYVPDYQFSPLNVDETRARANRPVYIKALKALIRGYQFFYRQREETLQVAMRESKLDRGYAERAWEFYTKYQIIPPDGSPSLKGVEAIIKIMADAGEFAGRPTPAVDKIVSLAYLQEAQKALGLR